MENEEIRGLMHKKASEDQLVAFVKLKFGALSLLSLSHSLSWSLRVFLEHSSLEERKGKARKGKERQARNKERKAGSNNFNRNTCR